MLFPPHFHESTNHRSAEDESVSCRQAQDGVSVPLREVPNRPANVLRCPTATVSASVSVMKGELRIALQRAMREHFHEQVLCKALRGGSGPLQLGLILHEKASCRSPWRVIAKRCHHLRDARASCESAGEALRSTFTSRLTNRLRTWKQRNEL